MFHVSEIQEFSRMTCALAERMTGVMIRPISAGLNPQLFGESHFRFVDDLFQAGEAGKGKAVDGNGADFADGRFFQRRTAAFFVNQHQH